MIDTKAAQKMRPDTAVGSPRNMRRGIGRGIGRNGGILVWLVALAWVGNALYAVGETGGLLKFWSPALVAFAMITFMVLHGRQCFGTRLIWAFLAVVFVTGWCLETLSIHTGFPFGSYHYTQVMSPFLGHVPVFVLPAYSVMGYVSFMLAKGVLRPVETHVIGPTHPKHPFVALVLVPVVAAMLMVVWDLSMDPLRASVESRWIWRQGGAHYGVPLLNYFGWFVTTWLMFQIFALVLWRFGTASKIRTLPIIYPITVALMYSGFAVEYVLNPFVANAAGQTVVIHGEAVLVMDIFAGISGLAAMTMLPLTALGLLTAWRPAPVAATAADEQQAFALSSTRIRAKGSDRGQR